MHSTNTRQSSMTPVELRHRLAELKMDPGDLAQLCGVDDRAVRRWLAMDGQKTAQSAPPYVRTVLDLYARGRPQRRVGLPAFWDRETPKPDP